MKRAIIVYWSGTGNTEIMAEAIKEGMEDAGLNVDLKEVYDVSIEEVLKYDKIALGCPSMGLEELEEEDFEPFMQKLEINLANKQIALFGSYGWGEAEWMELWEKRIVKAGASLFEKGLVINSTPSSDEEDECIEYGTRFANF